MDNRMFMGCFKIECRYDAGRWGFGGYFNRLIRDLPYKLIQTNAGPRLDANLEVALFSISSLSSEEAYDRYVERVAVKTFLQFVTGPWFDKIARCQKCSKFLLKTRTDKMFCTAECARSTSALNAHRTRRREEHQTKLSEVQRAAAKFEKLSSATKERIVKRRRGRTTWLAEEAGCSPKFVTLALRELGKFQ